MPAEKSYRERQEQAAGCQADQALDVALIDGIFFCTVPEEAPQAGGEVVPFFLVTWMKHFDFKARMQEVGEGTGSHHMSPAVTD